MTGASSTSTKVPFLDLGAAHASLKAEILGEVAELIESSAFVNGPQVGEFERAFASFCGAEHCVGVASGLDALRLGLLAAGIDPGDEVIAPAMTFVATVEAITQAGGVPVLVDVSEQDYCLDAEAAEAAVTERTRFVLPVHLYGQMADMSRIRRLADRYRLTIVEDACQAHGASRDGITAGERSTAAFSFYPGKNLGAFGDAGAVVTRDEALAARVRMLREHGQATKYEHTVEGYTSRLDTVQAIVLLRKLEHLSDWNIQRREVAAFYAAELDGVGDLSLPPVPEGSAPVWHLYVVRTADPEELRRALATRGVATARHYPQAVHETQAYAHLGRTAFPVAEALAREVVSLPIFPGMTAEQATTVVTAVRDYFDNG